MNEWDEVAEAWDTDEGPRAYAEAAHASLLRILDARGAALSGSRLCDFGCGTGLLAERLAGEVAAIDAVDTSVAMLAQLEAKVRSRGWGHVNTSTDLGDGLARYDLVVCSSVCGFLDDYPGTVAGLAARLEPGGVFVQWDWEREGEDRDAPGLTRGEVRQALEAAGLVAVDVDSAFEVVVEGQAMRPIVGSGQRPPSPRSPHGSPDPAN